MTASRLPTGGTHIDRSTSDRLRVRRTDPDGLRRRHGRLGAARERRRRRRAEHLPRPAARDRVGRTGGAECARPGPLARRRVRADAPGDDRDAAGGPGASRAWPGADALEPAADGGDPGRFDSRHAHCEVLVIGAGESGRKAAAVAQVSNPEDRVLLIDADPAATGDGVRSGMTALGIYDHGYVTARRAPTRPRRPRAGCGTSGPGASSSRPAPRNGRSSSPTTTVPGSCSPARRRRTWSGTASAPASERSSSRTTGPPMPWPPPSATPASSSSRPSTRATGDLVVGTSGDDAGRLTSVTIARAGGDRRDRRGRPAARVRRLEPERGALDPRPGHAPVRRAHRRLRPGQARSARPDRGRRRGRRRDRGPRRDRPDLGRATARARDRRCVGDPLRRRRARRDRARPAAGARRRPRVDRARQALHDDRHRHRAGAQRRRRRERDRRVDPGPGSRCRRRADVPPADRAGQLRAARGPRPGRARSPTPSGRRRSRRGTSRTARSSRTSASGSGRATSRATASRWTRPSCASAPPPGPAWP